MSIIKRPSDNETTESIDIRLKITGSIAKEISKSAKDLNIPRSNIIKMILHEYYKNNG